MPVLRSAAWAESPAGYVVGLRCRLCGIDYPAYYLHGNRVCLDCYIHPRHAEEAAPRRIVPTEPRQGRDRAARMPALSEEAVKRLPGWQRRVYDALAGGKRQREVARELGISEAAVSRAAKALRLSFANTPTPDRKMSPESGCGLSRDADRAIGVDASTDTGPTVCTLPRTDMSTVASEPLLTVGQIAAELDVPLHRVEYVIKAHDIEPIARLGILRGFDREALERVRQELQRQAR